MVEYSLNARNLSLLTIILYIKERSLLFLAEKLHTNVLLDVSGLLFVILYCYEQTKYSQIDSLLLLLLVLLFSLSIVVISCADCYYYSSAPATKAIFIITILLLLA